MNWKIFSYKNGEFFAKEAEVFHSILSIISELDIHIISGKKRALRKYFQTELISDGWNKEVVIEELENATLLIPSYVRGRVALEIETYHQSKVGTEFLKFEIMSNKHLGYIDFGIMISFTKELQNLLNKKYNAKWEGSISYEQLVYYSNFLKFIVSVPLVIIGVDL